MAIKKKGKRGFASMDPEKQRKIAAKGGKAAHKTGKAHKFNSVSGTKAGKKGAKASAVSRQR